MSLDHLKRQKPKSDSKAPPAVFTTPSQPQSVRYRCGHERPASLFGGQNCPECIVQTRARKKLAREKKRKSSPSRNDRRLPDGAHFDVRYDAESMTWGGCLLIGDIQDDDFQKYTATASGVFRLLSELDRQYRAAAAVEEKSH